jgi:hypothetical protein
MGGSKFPCRLNFYYDPIAGHIKARIDCDIDGKLSRAALNTAKNKIAKSTPKFKRFKETDGTPVLSDGTGQINGQFGPVIPRQKGDWREVNKAVYEIRKGTRESRDMIAREAANLKGQARQDYLDNHWTRNESAIHDLRGQYLVYGKNSVQGRLIDNQIKGLVNLQNSIERQSGYRAPFESIDRGGNLVPGTPRPERNPRKFLRGLDKFGKEYPGGRRKDSRGNDKDFRGTMSGAVPYSGPKAYVDRMIAHDARDGIYYKGVDYNKVGKDFLD